MKLSLKGSAVTLVAGSALGLFSLGASAATCNYVAKGWSFTVESTPPAAECWDYGEGSAGVGNYDLVDDRYFTEVGRTYVTPPPDDSPGSPGTSDAFQITRNYTPVEEVQSEGEELGEFFGTYLSFDEVAQTFSISGLSANSFIVLFKQASAWAAFLIPGNASGGTYSFAGLKGAPADLSHVSLFADDPRSEVPLPAAAWLLGSGLLGLFAVGRRRKGAQVAAA